MKIVFTIILFLSSLLSFAQDKKEAPKKEVYKLSSTIKTVRGYLKDGKNSEANNEIEKAIKAHPEACSSAHLYALKAQALQNLVLDENKKMYLKQKTDTTKYFSYINSLYEAALTCDSLEQIPDEKGRVKMRHRVSNQQKLLQFRKNLSTADKFYYQKKDFKTAFQYADLYLSSKHSPIFDRPKGGNALADETDSIPHASLAVFLAYAYNNYKGVTKYLPIAVLDTAHLAQIYEVGAQSYYALGDTISANELLQRGVNEYPSNEFFYMTLLKYYNGKQRYNDGIELIDSILVHTPDNRNCLFLKSKEYEYLGDLDNSIAVMNRVVELNPEDYEAFSTLGNMNLDKAHKEYQNFNLKVTDPNYQVGKQKINEYYKHAKVAYEQCRKYAQKNTDLWLSGLRECYYKLNQGKELKQLEKIK